MRIDDGTDGLHHVLSNSPQPVCPCNHLYYVEETATGWTMPLELTVDNDLYDRPSFPSLECDSTDQLHAMWRQLSYDALQQPSGEYMYYMNRTGPVWLDDSHLLEGVDAGRQMRDPDR